MSMSLVYLVGGLALLLAVVLPAALRRVALSAPVVLVAAGFAIGFVPLPPGLSLYPGNHPLIVTHLTELAVLVSLVGVGLAIDRRLDLRRWSSVRAWRHTWRLLLIAMPLCIAATAALGVALGFPLSAALLVGAALAPTDPVLAADVQVEGPTTEAGEHVDEGDEVRFALTSEAGLNDALAFPFVAAALLLANGSLGAGGWIGWFGWHLVGRTLIGGLVGWAAGWALGRLAFRSPVASVRLAERGEPLLAFAALGVAYGVAELLHGWGFLAVFVAAVALRNVESHSSYHELMHTMVERMELLLTLLLLLLLGVALSNGLLAGLTWRGAIVGLALVLVLRPLLAWVALGRDADRDYADDGRLGPRERWVTAFFGVRGIGSLFYASYGLSHGSFSAEHEIWATIGFTVVLSVVAHGVLATPVLRWLGEVRGPAPDTR